MTTIQPPTSAMRSLAGRLQRLGATMIAIGDMTGPNAYEISGVEFVPYEAQLRLPFQLARNLPANKYARKNIGYLLAVARGAECLYDTDDDNAPCEHWMPRQLFVRAEAVCGRPWANVYALFANQPIWPRGLPLEYARRSRPLQTEPEREVEAPVQQVLVDISPDVDATWRLLFGASVRFTPRASVQLAPGSWCPFNSQATWWWPIAYPLMYLPTFCSPRVGDIWRSLVAQRCLWELGCSVVFHSADVEHIRNEHDPLQDFQDEIVGYVRNAEIARALEALPLHEGRAAMLQNLRRCYTTLIQLDVLPHAEGRLVDYWIRDFTDAWRHGFANSEWPGA